MIQADSKPDHRVSAMQRMSTANKEEMTLQEYLQSIKQLKQEAKSLKKKAKQKVTQQNIERSRSKNKQKPLKHNLAEAVGSYNSIHNKKARPVKKSLQLDLPKQLAMQTVQQVIEQKKQKLEQKKESSSARNSQEKEERRSRGRSRKPSLRLFHSASSIVPHRQEANSQGSSSKSEGVQKSVYQLAVSLKSKKSHQSRNSHQTHMTRRSSLTRMTGKSKPREKKNFKKMFMEKKYNTRNLSQINHKVQKENELQVRQLKNVHMISFGRLVHERRQLQDAVNMRAQEVKDFEVIRKSIERDIRNQVLIPEGQTRLAPEEEAIFGRKLMKPIYEDRRSIEDNIDIREYSPEAPKQPPVEVVRESQPSIENQIPADISQIQKQNYEAIAETFEARQNHSLSKSPEKQPSPQSLADKGLALLASSLQESKNEQDEEQSNLWQQQEEYAKEMSTRQKTVIGDQLFGFINQITYEDNPYFSHPIKRLVTLSEKLKYNFDPEFASTRQKLLIALKQLLDQRQQVQTTHQSLVKRLQDLSKVISSQNQQRQNKKAEAILQKHKEEVSKLLGPKTKASAAEQVVGNVEQKILIHKIVIKMLISKSCALLIHNIAETV